MTSEFAHFQQGSTPPKSVTDRLRALVLEFSDLLLKAESPEDPAVLSFIEEHKSVTEFPRIAAGIVRIRFSENMLV